MERTNWFKDATIYQIYPRSFCDSNGDGIGDLQGIISKLDYIKDLGVDCVWLSPVYKSPNDDNGYDISDYRDIMDEFGTLSDWDDLVAGIHARGMKLVMDLVSNHTSDEHKWFEEAKSSRDNPYHDYYFFREGKGKDKKKVPNNWTSRFGGTAWEYNEETDEYYLHLFTKKQPDLNWDNPKVRQEIQDIVKFWLDRGCDGFRCDVITYISKKKGLPNGKPNVFLLGDENFTHGPHIHEYLKELHDNVLVNYDYMMVGEGPGMDLKHAKIYTAPESKELDMIFTFEHVNVDTYFQALPRKFNLVRLKKIFERYQKGLHNVGWNSLYFENHDQPRSISRFVGKYGDKRDYAAKMLAVALYMMQGTAFVYEGQEIGMANYPWKKPEEMQDVLFTYINAVIDKIKIVPWAKKIAFKVMKTRARDNGRTPMQWNDGENAGFTTGKPWIAINPDYVDYNAEKEARDPDSVLSFYKQLIRYRKGNEVVINGDFKQYYPKSKDIFCYEREYKGKRLFIITNFKNKEVEFRLPEEVSYTTCKVGLSNYKEDTVLKDMILKPYEAIIFELE